MKKLYILSVLISLTLASCIEQGVPGPEGPPGYNGLDGLDGEESYVFEYEFYSPRIQCFT